jgi:NADH-ubiquinone oxidoreductase chain 2
MLFLAILFIIVAVALPSVSKGLPPVLLTRITSIIFIYSSALSFNVYYIQSIGSGIGIYSGLFHVTTISQLLDTFLLLIASLILVAWPIMSKESISNLQTENKNIQLEGRNNKVENLNYAGEYSLIVLFSTLGSTLLISSADLITMYLSIELQSFGVYILATLYRNSESATSAGLKYFLLGGLSSCLILLGAGLIYTYTGLTNFEAIYSLVSVYDMSSVLLQAGANGFTLGIILIIVGFLFKVSAAPLHNWSPDVYDDSPTIVTIWLTTMPKIAILIFLLELITQSTPSVAYGGWIGELSLLNGGFAGENIAYTVKNLLLISSLLSLIIGTVVGLAQSRIKRLLAYSTISHIGFILLALAINTEQSIESLIFYIIQYSLTNLTTFLVIIALGYIINNNINTKSFDKGYYKKGSEKDLGLIIELKGQFFANPILSLSLSICLFSMAGIPPLIGFFSKQFVLYSAIESGYYFMAVVAIVVSVIIASYYLKIIRVLHSESLTDSHSGVADNKDQNSFKNVINEDKAVSAVITNFHSFLISTLTLTILLFVLKPSLILNSTQLLSLSLYNY